MRLFSFALKSAISFSLMAVASCSAFSAAATSS